MPEHFHFGTHPHHGFVAAATANLPAHLADWFLTQEQFESVPGTPGLYRLSDPDRDGQRRTRQAVQDLRRHGYTVQADYALDPALTPGPPQHPARHGQVEQRSRIAQAAAARSPQRGPAPATPLGGPPVPPSSATAPPAPGRTKAAMAVQPVTPPVLQRPRH
ncbi:hypothetical protein K7I03_28495 [Streptomyces mobaraensis]|nr:MULTISPECIES: hypothetical protein [Streptomyces]UBI41304.1 hypothetical protein K7I03_28495 [Streptomyces mobaraensis]UKW33802.1 hypothetical protein MCU78_28425 [Streptomyces sp. TYQ1024]